MAPCSGADFLCDLRMRSLGCVPPRDFPSEVQGVYDPVAVHGWVEDALARSETLSDSLLAVDCDEYPCILLIRREAGTLATEWIAEMEEDGLWGAPEGPRMQFTSQWFRPGSQLRVDSVVVYPDDLDSDARSRAVERVYSYSVDEMEALHADRGWLDAPASAPAGQGRP